MQKIAFETHSANGRLAGVKTLPDGTPRGVLLCLHGGPGGNLSGNAGGFDPLADLAANAGFATIQFSFYGSAPSDGTQAETSIKTQIDDYTHMLSFAAQTFSCPVHVVGESAGATIVSQCWFRDVKSCLLLWPAFDLADTDLRDYLTDEKYAEAKGEGCLKDGETIISVDLLEELRTLDFNRAFEIPPNLDIFIAHGQADKEVPYAQSLRACAKVGGRLQFFGHPKADHGFKDPALRAELFRQIAAWLEWQ